MWWKDVLTLMCLYVLSCRLHVLSMYFIGINEAGKRVLKPFLLFRFREFIVGLFVGILNTLLFPDEVKIAIVMVVLAALRQTTINIINKSTENQQ